MTYYCFILIKQSFRGVGAFAHAFTHGTAADDATTGFKAQYLAAQWNDKGAVLKNRPQTRMPPLFLPIRPQKRVIFEDDYIYIEKAAQRVGLFEGYCKLFGGYGGRINYEVAFIAGFEVTELFEDWRKCATDCLNGCRGYLQGHSRTLDRSGGHYCQA